MLFSEIVDKLVKLPNCSITVGGCLFIDDLHKYVRDTSRDLTRLRDQVSNGFKEPFIMNPFYNSWDKESSPRLYFTNNQIETMSKQTKEMFLYILTNYDKARTAPVGNKRPR